MVLADDDVLLRSGMASLLERPGFEVVGQAGDGRELLDLVRQLIPDLVVVDIRMPPTQTVEGLEAARTIREELPDIAIMVLSAHVDVEHAMTLLSTGHGIGYLLKSRVVDVDDFVDSLAAHHPGVRRSSIWRSWRSWSRYDAGTTLWMC